MDSEKVGAENQRYFQRNTECTEESRLDQVYRRDLVRVSDLREDG
jgi:hypothetical protein